MPKINLLKRIDLYKLLEDEEWVKTHPFIDDPVEYLMSQGWIRYESLS